MDHGLPQKPDPTYGARSGLVYQEPKVRRWDNLYGYVQLLHMCPPLKPHRTAIPARTSLVGLGIATALIVSLTMPYEAAGQGSATTVARDADGHPDLSGIWQAVNTAAWDLEPHLAQPDVPAGIGVIDGNQIPHTAERSR